MASLYIVMKSGYLKSFMVMQMQSSLAKRY